ncbi:family 20 glycosylhydrolase [Pedobacter yulinensis]|nr:family 20 glycosylhydrolase [Pedobacter yulinensis]
MLKIKRIKCGLTVSLLLSITTGYAQTDSVLVKSVPEIRTPTVTDRTIHMPEAPAGYRLLLKGSDHVPIVDSTGRISRPLVATKVNLYFQLVSNTVDTLRYDLTRAVTVPGKHADAGSSEAPFVIPALREWYGAPGSLELRPQTRIVVSSKNNVVAMAVAKILKDELAAVLGRSPQIVAGAPAKGDIYLTTAEADRAIGQEGYYFTVTDKVAISASHYQGLFWGTRTLLQLLDQSNMLPRGTARDYPEFKVRGFVLDVGRKFFRLQFLKDYVKLMSYYKMNDFHIHLNDNGFKKYFNDKWEETYSAFRLENSMYPGLTAKDGSYTKQEFKDLQDLAARYAVRIIPEIDAPAHSLAFTKAVPEIASKIYGMDHLDLHNPLTLTTMKNIFKEYISGPNPVFKGEEVHIGTDEYAKKDAEVFRAYTDEMIRFVEQFGKKARLWGALTHAQGKTPVKAAGVTMNTWYNGYANPVHMKKLGYQQISTPDGWLYIVPLAGYYYDYLNLKNIYNRWTPYRIGNVVFPQGDPTIIGGAFAVWNDIAGNGISEKDVHDRVFPALQTLAQKMWSSGAAGQTFEQFDARRKLIGEGPQVNIRGTIAKPGQPYTRRFSFDASEAKVLLNGARLTAGHTKNALSFTGARSFAQLPLAEVGYDYTVSFWINPAQNVENAVVFSSPNASIKLKQLKTGKLGFSRDGYDISFDYTLPENAWTMISVSGTSKGTKLYVNGALRQSLYDNWIQYNDKDKTRMRKSETLVFPLQTIGGFSGKLDELQVWNRVLTGREVQQLFDREK